MEDHKFFNPNEIHNILNKIKEEQKNIYIMGCGGVSMSIIADYLSKNNFIINGVDVNPEKVPFYINFNNLYKDHNVNNIDKNTKAIIVSHFFIDGDYPEIALAKSLNIPIILRIDFINYLANQLKNNHKLISIIGTSGKTTTTYFGFTLNKLLGNNPSILGGSYLSIVGNNYYLGTDNVFIENDESRDEHLRIIADVLILTSLSPDHLEEKCYQNDYNILKNSILKQINQSKMVIYYSDNGDLDDLIKQSNKTIGIDCFSYSDVNKNSHCYVENLNADALGSTGQITIKKDNNIYKLTIPVPFSGIKNFLNYSAVIFNEINKNNYEKIIELSRFIYLAPERGTYCGTINQTIIINNFAQVVEEFLYCAINYKNLFPHKKIYLAIEIVRLDRYNREIVLMDKLFNYVDKIFMAPPFSNNKYYNFDDSLVVKNNNMEKIQLCPTINDFYNTVKEFCINNNEPAILICSNYTKPCGLKLIKNFSSFSEIQ